MFTSDHKNLSEAIAGVFPAMDSNEQAIALVLYRLLAKGDPVATEQICLRLGLLADQVNDTLRIWPGVFFDENRRVIGFWGLSLQETPHRLEVNGKTIYGWCAWDTLFIPELLGTSAQVVSTCPVSGIKIKLVVSPGGIEAVDPGGVTVSFLVPGKGVFQEDIVTSFCHFVHFFADPVAAQRWTAARPGTFLLSLEDAFRVGQLTNAARFGQTPNNRINS